MVFGTCGRMLTVLTMIYLSRRGRMRGEASRCMSTPRQKRPKRYPESAARTTLTETKCW
jgi:hypothetical protein